MEEKQKIIEDLFEKGILVSQDVLDNKIEKALEGNLIAKLEQERDLLVLNTDYVDIVTKQKSLVDWYEVDFYRVQAEKERDDELYQAQLQQFKQAELQVSGPSGSDFAQKQQLFSSEQEMNPLEDGENFTAAHSSNSTFSDTAATGSDLEMTSVTPQLIHASPELTSILSSPSGVPSSRNFWYSSSLAFKKSIILKLQDLN